MAKKKKSKRGGSRPGSGRKVGPGGPVTVIAASVPESLVERLDGLAEKRGWNRSQAVTEAIRGLLDAQHGH